MKTATKKDFKVGANFYDKRKNMSFKITLFVGPGQWVAKYPDFDFVVFDYNLNGDFFGC